MLRNNDPQTELRADLDAFDKREINKINFQIIEIDERLAALKQKKEAPQYSNENLSKNESKRIF